MVERIQAAIAADPERQTHEEVGVVRVTPNGLPIYFQHDPRRYRLGPSTGDPELNGTAWRVDAEPDWDIVPSVSEALDILHKPGLPWWGMVTGVEGLMTLTQLGLVREVIHLDRPHLAVAQEVIRERGQAVPATPEQLVDLLTTNQLTVNHVRDRAGDRGLAVHDALEGWAASGKLPDPNMYAATELPFVKALRQFLLDADPEPLASEVMVASREFGYAGRYDLRLRISRPRPIVARCYPKKAPLYKQLGVGEILTDLKSSKGVYESHPRQLEAYERASVESGYEPTSARGILHVTDSGQYEFVRSWANFNDFLAVLMVWRSDQAMKKRKKEITG